MAARNDVVSTAQKTGAMSETLQQTYPVSHLAGNRVWHDEHDTQYVQHSHDWHVVSSPQPRSGACPAWTAPLAQQGQSAQCAHILETLEALHDLARSGASSPPSRMSPAAPLPDSGIPAR